MKTALGGWVPLAPASLRGLLAGFAAPWWISGGWALDLYAGGALRGHGDVDVSMLRRDQTALASHPVSWDLHAVVAPGSLEPWCGEPLEPPVHEIWARPAPDEPWRCEFLLEEADGDEWVFRRDPRVRRPLAGLGVDHGGLPLLAPEIVLLYKAKAPVGRDEADFAAVLPLLREPQRRRLAAALETVHPGHPWAERL